MTRHNPTLIRRRNWLRGALGERGTALIEAAVTIPILLLIAIGIFEFGRAYQTWQILTNAAREAARMAVVPSGSVASAQDRARTYMQSGQLSNYSNATINVNRSATITVNGKTVSASSVTVSYPFQFIVLGPVAKLVKADSTAGNDLNMVATAIMRNETAQ